MSYWGKGSLLWRIDKMLGDAIAYARKAKRCKTAECRRASIDLGKPAASVSLPTASPSGGATPDRQTT